MMLRFLSLKLTTLVLLMYGFTVHFRVRALVSEARSHFLA